MAMEVSQQRLHEDLAGGGRRDPGTGVGVAGPPFRASLRLAGFFLALFGVSLAVYLATLCPTIYEEGTGENVVCVWGLGVPHPPGFPLYCLLGKAYEECLSRGENDEARIRLGNLCLRKRRDADAEREFRHVLVRQPDNVDARIGFASVFAIRGKPDEGIAHLQLAVKSNPAHLNALRMLGIAYLSVGRGGRRPRGS
jgi:tetratricopeptide (TPR) repeat protein